MQGNICVRIKSGGYVEALDLSRARRGVLHLTTIEDYQTAAEIPVYLAFGSERIPLATLNAERLSPLTSEECRLDLECRLEGRNRAEFRVVQNGRLVLTETRRLPIPGGGRRILTAAAILAVAAGLAVLLVPRVRGLSPDSRSRSGDSSRPGTSAESTAETRPDPAVPAPQAETAPAAPSTAPATAPGDSLAAAREAFRALGEETLTIYFSADSSEISPDQGDKLEKVAAVLARNPELGIAISGHCATAGTEKGRLALSQDRARAVFRALEASGWKPKAAPAVEGFGDERPATRAEDQQALNRRVEIRLAP